MPVQLSKISFICSFIFILLQLSCTSEQSDDLNPEIKTGIKLEKIDPVHSGVRFNNLIRENERLHAFIWNFIYQGAGVAIGDINNDGLPDIYFSGNMVSDKLYLNKGNFQFEDISLTAGIQDKLWSTGVNFVDINADGWLDIYVCKNFFLLQEGVRRNKLFINQKNLSFREAASEYGLDDVGFSIQSHFFDADNDGDLDMYLVNQPMDQYAAGMAKPESVEKLPATDRFYLNQNGKYVDKTEDLGFTNKAYGLSAITADMDKNGWNDIYLCNDYQHGDQFFLNHSGLAFSESIEERIGHSSFYSMGSDIDDINNDGWPDFISLDMAFGDHYRSKTNMESMRPDLFKQILRDGHHYQYAVNALQLNMGNAHFSEIAHYAGVSHTDWSWTPLLIDLDNDSYSDLVVSNGILRDLRNNDFIQKIRSGLDVYDYRTITAMIPSTPVPNKLYRNSMGSKFEDVGHLAGFDQETFSSGMAYGDLDGDGDADIVINNTNQPASIFKNNSEGNYLKILLNAGKQNTHGYGIQLVLFLGKMKICKTILSSRGYMSASESASFFGLGKRAQADSLHIYWNHDEYSVIHNIPANQTIKYNYDEIEKRKRQRISSSKNHVLKPATLIEYMHSENDYDPYEQQVLLPHSISDEGPLMSTGDFNQDAREDLFISASSGNENKLFIQNVSGKLAEMPISHNEFEKNLESLGSVFTDFDRDGDLDIYVTSGGSQEKLDRMDLLYINNNGQQVESIERINVSNTDGKIVALIDDSESGLPLIFRPARSVTGSYGKAGDAHILMGIENQLRLKEDWSLPGLGMITDVKYADLINDARKELILVGEWMAPKLLDISSGSPTEIEMRFNTSAPIGLWQCLSLHDFDKDGDLDILLGNLGENNKFHPSKNNPLYLHSGDIDDNGDHDVILSKKSDKALLPVRGKECSTEEVPGLNEKFESYHQFAVASLEEIYGESALNKLEEKYITVLSHLYLENASGQYIAKKLPDVCQYAPIKAFQLYDINRDGNMDFFYAGNHFPVEPETVRYDAGFLGACLGDGKGNFDCLSVEELGVYLRADFRDMKIIRIGIEDYLLVSSNGGPVRSFLINSKHVFQ